MANILNINAEQGANIIGDDAQPTLSLTNTSTGPGLYVGPMVSVSGASIAQILGNPVITSNATAVNIAQMTRTVIGSPSVALAMFSVSGASIPVFEFQANALVSAVSIIFAAGTGWAGMSGVRVKFSDGTTYGWIPVLPNAVFTAAAI